MFKRLKMMNKAVEKIRIFHGKVARELNYSSLKLWMKKKILKYSKKIDNKKIKCFITFYIFNYDLFQSSFYLQVI